MMGKKICLLAVMALFSLLCLSDSKAEEEYVFVNKWPEELLGLRGPNKIAVDSSGYVYVADTYNHRIQVFLPKSAVLYSIDLGKGWNSVSLPVSPINNALTSVMSSVVGKYRSVWALDPMSKNWMKYIAEGDPSHNSLNTMDSGIGYLVYMSDPGVLIIMQGTEPDHNVGLKAGLNIVGYPSMTSRSPQNALAGMPQGTTIYGYDGEKWLSYTIGGPNFFNDLNLLEPGHGYYIYIEQDWVWTVSP